MTRLPSREQSSPWWWRRRRHTAPLAGSPPQSVVIGARKGNAARLSRFESALLSAARAPLAVAAAFAALFVVAQHIVGVDVGYVAASYGTALPPVYNNLTNTSVICSIVSNEEYYIDEWLDYNLGIGFEHVYVYDNTLHFELGHGWLDRRPRLAGRVTITHYPGEGKQWTAYRDCAERVLKDGHRWIFYTDADEFLVLKKHDDVVSFLLEHDTNRMALAVNWQLHSWNGEMQYRPLPVTKRFNGKAEWTDSNHHVKTISNADKIDLTARHHPHYATLYEGNYAIDTNGNEVTERWMNPRYPSDVALVYHHNVKSWKEYIGKRTRGRATMTGKDLEDSMRQLIAEARRGGELRNASEVDNSAWDALKRTNPKYKFFDGKAFAFGSGKVDIDENSNSKGNEGKSIGICCHVKDQEAYIDEWADYHLALGFHVHLYDGTEDYWMRQWGENRRNETRLSLEHHPPRTKIASGLRPPLDDVALSLEEEMAAAYESCAKNRGSDHEYLAFMQVNDFFVASGEGPIVPHLLARTECAVHVEKKLFGTNGQVCCVKLPSNDVAFHFSLRRLFLLVHENCSMRTSRSQPRNDIRFESIPRITTLYWQLFTRLCS